MLKNNERQFSSDQRLSQTNPSSNNTIISPFILFPRAFRFPSKSSLYPKILFLPYRMRIWTNFPLRRRRCIILPSQFLKDQKLPPPINNLRKWFERIILWKGMGWVSVDVCYCINQGV